MSYFHLNKVRPAVMALLGRRTGSLALTDRTSQSLQGEFTFMLSFSAQNVGLISSFGLNYLVCLTALSLFLSPFYLVFAQRCKRLAENIQIGSSWEFSRFILEREITKLSNANKWTKNTLKHASYPLKWTYSKIMDLRKKTKDIKHRD